MTMKNAYTYIVKVKHEIADGNFATGKRSKIMCNKTSVTNLVLTVYLERNIKVGPLKSPSYVWLSTKKERKKKKKEKRNKQTNKYWWKKESWKKELLNKGRNVSRYFVTKTNFSKWSSYFFIYLFIYSFFSTAPLCYKPYKCTTLSAYLAYCCCCCWWWWWWWRWYLFIYLFIYFPRIAFHANFQIV